MDKNSKKQKDLKKRIHKYLSNASLKLASKRNYKKETEVLRNVFKLDEELIKIGVNKKYYISTYGCQMNVHDTEVISGILEMMSYEKTDNTYEADLIILNTCAVRENAENKVFGELGNLKHLKTENPNLLLGVCGCMPQEESVVNKILKIYNYVDLIFGTHNIYRLPQLIKEAYFNKEMIIEIFSQEGSIIENLPKNRESNLKAWVNISYGCDKFCTYCIIPFTRGKERSRLKEDVLNEVKILVNKGYKEITLLGQNVNSYGKDLKYNYDFSDLLESVANTGIDRIRFMTSHPWDFTDKMIDVIGKYRNIMPHVHLPVQSGSDVVIKRMRRYYSIEEYLNLYFKLRNIRHDMAITTDIIVGFPNETEEDFEKTLLLSELCKFDSAYTFIYSPREGTPAARLKDNIDIQTKKERLYRLNKVINEHALNRNKKYKGKYVKVLVHGVSKKNENKLSGYTEQNKLINFSGNSKRIGEIIDVYVEDVKTWSLIGK